MQSASAAVAPELTLVKKEANNVKHWYRRATVRATDRIIVPSLEGNEYIFPPSRQILVTHPLVQEKGEETIAYILAQSAYQYMYEIGLLETRFVIDCSLNIVNNIIKGFSDVTKREALAVVIDEGYHAYVALDFIMQMKEQNGVQPLEIPQTNGNLDAVKRAYETLDESIHMDFQLISVTLAEHTLTKDLLSIGSEKNMTETFTRVMTDHVSDEGRHANFFMTATTNYWANLSEDVKTQIGTFLPGYIDDYLAQDRERGFDQRVLAACGFEQDAIDQIIEDTNEEYLGKVDAYFVKTKAQLVDCIKKMNLLDHEPTREAFIKHGIEI